MKIAVVEVDVCANCPFYVFQPGLENSLPYRDENGKPYWEGAKCTKVDKVLFTDKTIFDYNEKARLYQICMKYFEASLPSLFIQESPPVAPVNPVLVFPDWCPLPDATQIPVTKIKE